MKLLYQKLCLIISIFISILSCTNKSKSTAPLEEKRSTIEMTTNYGEIVLELYNETPLHRDNFINLVQNNAYDSLLFHRVIENFMIQAGDPDSKYATVTDTLGEGDVPYKVQAEFNSDLIHKKGALAAARDNNPTKASSGMQFYIVQGKIYNDSLINRVENYNSKIKAQEYFKNDSVKKPILDSIYKFIELRERLKYSQYADSLLTLAKDEDNFTLYMMPEANRAIYSSIGGTPHLDQEYTVFGKIVKGLAIVDSIAKVQTDSLDRPIKEVRILKVNVIE